MYKKIIATLLFGLASSFAASWSYFPVKGEGLSARAGYIMEYGDWMTQGIRADVRYAIDSKWEFSLRNVGLQIFASDGYNALHEDCDEDVDGCSSSLLKAPILGVKRNLGQKTSIYLDANLPLGSVGTEEYFGEFAIDVGLQRGIILENKFSWTMELGYVYSFDRYTGMIVHASTEVDLSIGEQLIAFGGYEYRVQLTEETGAATYKIFAGASYALNENMSIEEEVSFASADLKEFQLGIDYNWRYVKENFGDEDDGSSVMTLKLSTYFKYSF